MTTTGRTSAQSKQAAIEAEWEQVKLSDKEEVAQKFLEKHTALLPGAWGDVGTPMGNHGPLYSSIFRQPPLRGLGPQYFPDFMWITRSTVSITPVCIEIERPTKKWFTQTAQPREEFTQALNQLAQWRRWFKIRANEDFFRSTYVKDRWPWRPLTPQFLLVYGRENEFTDAHPVPTETRHGMRTEWARENEHLITFDSLRWSKQREGMLTTSVHQNGDFEVSWINENFTHLGEATAAYYLGSPDSALAKNPQIDSIQAADIRAAWEDERKVGARLVAGETSRDFFAN